MPQNDQALLTRLKASGLDFVVIGGVCLVFHGAPMATFDLDICCPFGEENVRRIEAAVADLHPFHRLTANKLPLEMTRPAFAEVRNLFVNRHKIILQFSIHYVSVRQTVLYVAKRFGNFADDFKAETLPQFNGSLV